MRSPAAIFAFVPTLLAAAALAGCATPAEDEAGGPTPTTPGTSPASTPAVSLTVLGEGGAPGRDCHDREARDIRCFGYSLNVKVPEGRPDAATDAQQWTLRTPGGAVYRAAFVVGPDLVASGEDATVDVYFEVPVNLDAEELRLDTGGGALARVDV